MDNKQTKKSKTAKAILTIALIVAAFVSGYAIKSFMGSASEIMQEQTSTTQSAQEQTWWTCSMHPQIRQPKPGKCPICFMDLIPVENETTQVGPRDITFSEDALKLMEIQTTAVERKFVEAEIRLVGMIDYDETLVKNITAWVPGRIDRLYIDFTGISVAKGDHMVELYSPELISAQAELLEANKAAKNIKNETSVLVKETITATLEATGEKLKLLGLTDRQIVEIESSGKALTHITIYSPIGGVVVHKNAKEGMYVQTGTPIYTVADLSKLWVKLDAYESNLPWIRYGQEVEFTTETYPGQVFKGKVSFIDPVLDTKTRTVKLRVNMDNPEYKLKPDMFVRAVVRSRIAEGGKTMSPDMSGKWICPMHPAVVKEQAGSCDLCGMDLVTTESLGYTVDTEKEAPLVIPATTPLITGKRAVVYVKIQGTEKPTFEGRQIVLGPRAGDYYIVKSGLSEGDIVVTKGNFKIDSALQIQAKPSMMNPENDTEMMPHQHMDSNQTMTGEYQSNIESMNSEQMAMDTSTENTEQTTCPVMGGKIDKQYFTEYKGKKVYFCCPGCETEFLKDPEKYLSKLPQFSK